MGGTALIALIAALSVAALALTRTLAVAWGQTAPIVAIHQGVLWLVRRVRGGRPTIDEHH